MDAAAILSVDLASSSAAPAMVRLSAGLGLCVSSLAIPSITVNRYGAALASWMGRFDSDVAAVFPDLANFDNSWMDYNLLT